MNTELAVGILFVAAAFVFMAVFIRRILNTTAPEIIRVSLETAVEDLKTVEDSVTKLTEMLVNTQKAALSADKLKPLETSIANLVEDIKAVSLDVTRASDRIDLVEKSGPAGVKAAQAGAASALETVEALKERVSALEEKFNVRVQMRVQPIKKVDEPEPPAPKPEKAATPSSFKSGERHPRYKVTLETVSETAALGFRFQLIGPGKTHLHFVAPKYHFTLWRQIIRNRAQGLRQYFIDNPDQEKTVLPVRDGEKDLVLRETYTMPKSVANAVYRAKLDGREFPGARRVGVSRRKYAKQLVNWLVSQGFQFTFNSSGILVCKEAEKVAPGFNEMAKECKAEIIEARRDLFPEQAKLTFPSRYEEAAALVKQWMGMEGHRAWQATPQSWIRLLGNMANDVNNTKCNLPGYNGNERGSAPELRGFFERSRPAFLAAGLIMEMQGKGHSDPIRFTIVEEDAA